MNTMIAPKIVIKIIDNAINTKYQSLIFDAELIDLIEYSDQIKLNPNDKKLVYK